MSTFKSFLYQNKKPIKPVVTVEGPEMWKSRNYRAGSGVLR
jgi:hypothetical protein